MALPGECCRSDCFCRVARRFSRLQSAIEPSILKCGAGDFPAGSRGREERVCAEIDREQPVVHSTWNGHRPAGPSTHSRWLWHFCCTPQQTVDRPQPFDVRGMFQPCAAFLAAFSTFAWRSHRARASGVTECRPSSGPSASELRREFELSQADGADSCPRLHALKVQRFTDALSATKQSGGDPSSERISKVAIRDG